jgi:diaminopimelate decarboxylase
MPNKSLSKNFTKTFVGQYRPELERAIKAGVVINLDNEHEMDLIDQLLKTTCAGYSPPSVGLRINPVVGSGSIDIMSTATKASKFGLPVTESTRSGIIELYRKYDWLNGIHFHVGSQVTKIKNIKNIFSNST